MNVACDAWNLPTSTAAELALACIVVSAAVLVSNRAPSSTVMPPTVTIISPAPLAVSLISMSVSVPVAAMEGSALAAALVMVISFAPAATAVQISISSPESFSRLMLSSPLH